MILILVAAERRRFELFVREHFPHFRRSEGRDIIHIHRNNIDSAMSIQTGSLYMNADYGVDLPDWFTHRFTEILTLGRVGDARFM